jgi:hypothetical protein
LITPTSDSSGDAEPADDPETPFMILFVEMMIFGKVIRPDRLPLFFIRRYVYVAYNYTHRILYFVANADCGKE